MPSPVELTRNHQKGPEMTTERLEYLRKQIEGERISWGELLELQGMADQIDPGDVQLLQWAGVPEFPDSDQRERDGAAFVRMKDAMTEWLQMHVSSETAIEMVRDEVLDILISATTEEER